MDWRVERIVHFDFGEDFVKDGFVHFGFHGRSGDHFGIEHQRHFLGRLNKSGGLEWTLAPRQVFEGTPNLTADLQFPIYVDTLRDGQLIVSNFGNSMLFRIDPDAKEVRPFVEGAKLGIRHAGNCVVDDVGSVWLNDVDGCRVWNFDEGGNVIRTLGTGEPGFQFGSVGFENALFSWIYDLRKGPDGNIYVLDSRNYALRMLDLESQRVLTVAGTGRPGYTGDGGDPLGATFGGDPSAKFDGPISLSIDEKGNLFVGDRFNHVVRMIDSARQTIRTIAGDHSCTGESANDSGQDDPMTLRLPKISSMDYYDGRLFVPTDLTEDSGDLAVLRRP